MNRMYNFLETSLLLALFICGSVYVIDVMSPTCFDDANKEMQVFMVNLASMIPAFYKWALWFTLIPQRIIDWIVELNNN